MNGKSCLHEYDRQFVGYMKDLADFVCRGEECDVICEQPVSIGLGRQIYMIEFVILPMERLLREFEVITSGMSALGIYVQFHNTQDGQKWQF